MSSLLFEVGAEELPPSELPAIVDAFRSSARELLVNARLVTRELQILSTPRRLTLSVTGLADRQTDEVKRVTGPARKAAYDTVGRPTKAAEGFARANGVSVDDLVVIATERGEYVAVDRREKGQPTADVLPGLLTRLVGGLPFAKQMRWGMGDVRFSRPVRWVLALLNDVVVPVTVCGIASSRVTYGHRFLAPAAIELARADPAEYVRVLREAYVIALIDERRETLRGLIAAKAAELGHTAVIDEATLTTVLHLVEAPAVIAGTFPAQYLDLPREVVETTIRHHQKGFVLETPAGVLVPGFVWVSNMPGIDATEVRRGNERVIRARLADADFYFREDLKMSPESRVERLGGMVLHERLGTLREKTDRLVALVTELGTLTQAADVRALRRAAFLAKSDLPSGMVREFPELEGVIGGEYALSAGESNVVARAIREHYLPRSADGVLPESVEGALLAVADKTDTVVGIIGIGLLPTGSQDPYAVRRHAQGIIQISIGFGDRVQFSLSALMDHALTLLTARLTEAPKKTLERVMGFLRARLATILTGRGWRADVVEAVLASGFDVPFEVVRRVDSVTQVMQRADWELINLTFKRVINIIPADTASIVEPELFADDSERALYADATARGAIVRSAVAEGHYLAAFVELAALRPAVDAFFAAVLVMHEDPVIRANRLALLKLVASLLLPIVDLRRIHSDNESPGRR